MKTRIVSQLLEKADITAKTNKKSTCAKKYKFKKEIKKESIKENQEVSENINAAENINIPEDTIILEKNEKIINIIKEYFNSIVKEFYFDSIKLPEEINEKINELEVNDEEIFPLISKIKEIDETLSNDDIILLIEEKMNEFNNIDNILNTLNLLSESKKLPISFGEYRKKNIK